MPPTQDNVRVIFLVLILFWLASSPDSSPGLITGPNLTKSRLARQRHSHGVLNTTEWGDFAPRLPDDPPDSETKYLNLTGFREEDGYVWEDLRRFKDRCEEWSQHAVGIPEAPQPVWQNATGVVRGSWVKLNASSPRYHSSYNLSGFSPGVTWSNLNSDWSRNVTGPDGKMLVRIEDYETAGAEPEVLDSRLYQESEVKAREASATVNIEDIGGAGSGWEMRLHGVHWPKQGAMLFTTTSEKFAGIFGLPHLTTRPEFFESSQALLSRTLNKVLEKKEQRAFIDQADPWSSTVDRPGEAWSPSPHCEYLLYIQIHPPDPTVLKVQPSLTGPENTAKAIQDIERELRFPQGTSNQVTPMLQMSAVVFSPDCAFFLETKGPPAYAPDDGQHLIGVKQEVFLYSVSTWLLGLALIVFGQVQLLKAQMRETSTPSTLGRISFYTVGMILLADGIVFSCAAGWSLTASTTLLPSLLVTCITFISMTVGTFFLSEIYKVQEPEWRRQERERVRQRERERQNSPQANTPAPTSTTPSNAPTPDPITTRSSSRPPSLVTTGRPPESPPIIIPSDQDVDAEIAEVTNDNTNSALPAPVTAGTATNNQSSETPISKIFLCFLAIGLVTLFLSLSAAAWRRSLRSAYFNTLMFIYLSLWTPQIYRNVYRNCRRALSWKFVVGQSVLRLLPIAYFYLLPDNFAFAEPDWTAFAVLAGWVWCQIWILAAQAVLGPRFGIPVGWMPEAWEYHPVLRERDVETGVWPIGLVSAPSSPTTLDRSGGEEPGRDKKKDGGRPKHYHLDCAICREDLEVPVIRAGDDDPTAGGVSGVFARRMYMVTPCRHIFHSECLEGWMRFRLQCPICREELPPL
ncbi:hypothetical protein F4778DRAFT_44624 [Xylariomycetidae sp. FL2044]|nr:hypothetical protein F4778DRAFT_44624 [Xylariomycetidae sp. FL2044]